MQSFFPTVGQDQSNIPSGLLAVQQASLRDKKISALLEIEPDSTQPITLVFAHGEQVGAFELDGEQMRPTSLGEVPAGEGSFRVAVLPDVAARLAWLACESRTLANFSIGGANGWTAQLNTWRQEGYEGLVQVTHAAHQGFVYIHNGRPLKYEAAFFGESGFSETLPTAWDGNEINLTAFERNLSANSYQCLGLRQSAFRWSEAIMKSYRNIAGEKFLQAMSREAMAQIRPWEWNIQIAQGGIIDQHFFDGMHSQAQAYQAIFMACGAQMGFAIGNYLTLRILIEMFDELNPDERAMLERHRLIPAAFSD